MIHYLGDASYKDVVDPASGMAEDGTGHLVRVVAGRRDQLQTFVASLAQGQLAPAPYAGFKLQSWDPETSDPVWGKVTLNYKGLTVTPPDQIFNEIVETSGSSSHHWDPPYDYGGEFFAVSAIMEFTYYAGQTTYKYNRPTDPGGSIHSSLALAFIYSIKKVRTTVSNEDGSQTVFGWMAPVGIVSATTPRLFIGAVGFRSTQQPGNAYWECEDVVRAELQDSGS